MDDRNICCHHTLSYDMATIVAIYIVSYNENVVSCRVKMFVIIIRSLIYQKIFVVIV